MNNKKLIRNLIIGIVVLAVLCGLLILAYKMPEKNSENTDNNSSELNNSKEITVIDIKTEDVKSITVENEYGKYTIINKGDNEYEMQGNGGIPYSSPRMASNFSSFLNISAEQELTDEDINFSQTAKATLIMNDGKKEEIILGNEVIGKNQNFLQYNGKQYVVWSYVANEFLSKPDDFRNTQLATITTNFKSFEIKKEGQDYVKLKVVENEEESKALDIGANYILTYPKQMAASEDRLTPLFELIGQQGYSVNVISFADSNIANKSKYHIGKKSITFKEENAEYTFEFGDKDENGNIYTVFNDSNYIFTMSSDLFDLIDTYTPDVLMEKFAHLVLITKINQVVFEGGGNKYTLDISGSEDNYTYKVNGKKTDEDVFKKVYQEIIGITVDSTSDTPIKAEKADYTVTFKYLDGSKVTYSYVSYDARNYVLQKDGQGEKILLKKRLPTAMENIKKLLK